MSCHSESTTWHRQKRVEAILDAFEADWRNGMRPGLRDVLKKHPDLSEELVPSLLELDCHYRRLCGESPQVADYADFPPDCVRQALRDPGESVKDDCVLSSPADGHWQSGQAPRHLESQLYHVGQTAAGFKLLKEIGYGGFGQVFASKDAKLGRQVAIKILHSGFLKRPKSRELFKKEAQALAAISNDHVVPIYQVGEDRDNLFLVMPLLAGETLQAKLERDGILSLDEFQRIAWELGVGLAAIHAKGLIHRDLKPANIWLESGTGRVKILDLGLADGVANLRQYASAGTPAYMSPELIHGAPLDFRSDLFSVGAILYECLTAQKAFPGDSVGDTIEAVLHNQPLSLEQANPAVPPEVRDLVYGLLQKDRTRRPVSVQAMLDALPREANTTPRSQVAAGKRERSQLIRVSGVMLLLTSAVMLGWRHLHSSSMNLRTPSPSPEPPALETLGIAMVEVTPLEMLPGGKAKPLAALGEAMREPVTTNHAFEVQARLSRPGYGYIVLYRADGESKLLYPYQDDLSPPLSAELCYPPGGKDVAYQLNDGPGVWAIAVVASESPLPSFNEWQASHSPAPWTAQSDPTVLKSVVIDDGLAWSTPQQGGGLSRGSRGEIKVTRLVPIQSLLDFWRESAQAAVTVIAFPVVER